MHLKTSITSLLCSILLTSKSVVGHDHGGDDNDAQFIVGEAEVKDLQWKWGFEVRSSYFLAVFGKVIRADFLTSGAFPASQHSHISLT